jgi:flavin reductase (DIM6/NTAB) family NADH-FMN oxidoreductase RutF
MSTGKYSPAWGGYAQSSSVWVLTGKLFLESAAVSVHKGPAVLKVQEIFRVDLFVNNQSYAACKKGRGGMPKRQQIEKQSWKPGNVLSPVPAVLVSCGGVREWKPNLITIAWAGNVCSEPPMLSISIRPERYSYEIIETTREFVVNIPSLGQAKAVDWCGMVSGRNVDKFADTGLSPAHALKVQSPIVLECPLNIECRVRESLKLGSHTLFVAEVVAVQVSATLIDARGRLRLEKGGLLAFAHGQYFALGRCIGRFGFSVRKRKSQPRR